MANRIGIDTGGTFTDFIWLDPGGSLQVHKELSTPVDPSEALLSGLERMVVGIETNIIHGSTVATNALLERRGARTALITTEGFADVLAIGRQNRPELYALVPQKPEPLVQKKWRFEVAERVTSRGRILTPLDISQVQAIIERFVDEQIESVAICLLFSFLRSEHEQRIGQEIQTYYRDLVDKLQGEPIPSLYISLSSEVIPEFREFERTSTTVINAYVAPIMDRYLQRTARNAAPRPLSIMQSSGGISSVEQAVNHAARTVLSGPAGGVVGARYVAGLAGYENIITFDMGGTSTDVALCEGKLPLTAEGDIEGMPLRLPMIDIHTVGAGGGSLARIDPGGALNVGPQSAGAVPGPACYSKISADRHLDPAAVEPTTTDANLVLGRLDAAHFLGGNMALYPEAARRSLEKIAQLTERPSVEVAALDIVRVANATMERAIRRISVERGHDPRRFTLVAFGGAGPLHACELAAALRIPRILVPSTPGVLSALGMLAAPPMKEWSKTIMLPIQGERDENTLEQQYRELEAKAVKSIVNEGYPRQDITSRCTLDMRYVGQSFELRVDLPEIISSVGIKSMFHDAHLQRYGYSQLDATVEIVNIRSSVTAEYEPPQLPKIKTGSADPSEARVGEKEVWFEEFPLMTPLYSRPSLRAGNRILGPAVIFQYDSTTILPPGWQGTVDIIGNLVITNSELAI